MIVVNLFGGPGSGKSTTRAGLFYLMKLAGMKVEEAPEWIKHKVYEEDPYPFKDQLYTLAKQNKQVRELDGKVDWCVTDSPILLSLIYGEGKTETFKKLVHETYDSYDNINIFIDKPAPTSIRISLHSHVIRMISRNNRSFIINDCVRPN